MFKNRIAWKLAGYFAAAILVFAVVLGVTFGHFFHNNTIDRTKRELQARAEKVSAILGDNYDRQVERGIVGLGFSSRRLIAYVNTITMDDVWIADPQQNVEMRNHLPANGELDLPAPTFKIEVHTGPQGRDLPPVVTGVTTVGDLPAQTRELIKNAFKGKSQVEESFDRRLKEVMVEAAVPIYEKNGGIAAVLVLRTPMIGLRQSWESGLNILLISSLTALLLALVVAGILSLKFTRPLNKIKETALRLSDKDYTARSYVTQKDEVGELAVTVDGLAGRLQTADVESSKLDKLRRDFIANVSHELRTPVTVLRGSLEALRDKVVEKPEDVERYHDTMYKETLFLQRLINDLLDLSRLQNADFQIEKAPVNLCEIVQEAARSGRHLGHAKQIEVTCELDTPVYRLIGDFGRLNQMLLIFIDNAVKFSPEGSRIELQLKARRLTVTDHGCGIKKEDLQYVFDRFYKTRVEKNKSGSGLGLAIAREIAERHGIILTMRSVQGQGTVVEMQLPSPAPEVKPAEAPKDVKPA